MSIAVRLLRRRGISARGSVGTDKPLESMTDALGAFSATAVLLAVPPEPDSYWLERDSLTKARALTELPVTQAIVASAQPTGSTRRDPSRAERPRTHGRKGEPHDNRSDYI